MVYGPPTGGSSSSSFPPAGALTTVAPAAEPTQQLCPASGPRTSGSKRSSVQPPLVPVQRPPPPPARTLSAHDCAEGGEKVCTPEPVNDVDTPTSAVRGSIQSSWNVRTAGPRSMGGTTAPVRENAIHSLVGTPTTPGDSTRYWPCGTPLTKRRNAAIRDSVAVTVDGASSSPNQ